MLNELIEFFTNSFNPTLTCLFGVEGHNISLIGIGLIVAHLLCHEVPMIIFAFIGVIAFLRGKKPTAKVKRCCNGQ